MFKNNFYSLKFVFCYLLFICVGNILSFKLHSLVFIELHLKICCKNEICMSCLKKNNLKKIKSLKFLC